MSATLADWFLPKYGLVPAEIRGEVSAYRNTDWFLPKAMIPRCANLQSGNCNGLFPP